MRMVSLSILMEQALQVARCTTRNHTTGENQRGRIRCALLKCKERVGAAYVGLCILDAVGRWHADAVVRGAAKRKSRSSRGRAGRSVGRGFSVSHIQLYPDARPRPCATIRGRRLWHDRRDLARPCRDHGGQWRILSPAHQYSRREDSGRPEQAEQQSSCASDCTTIQRESSTDTRDRFTPRYKRAHIRLTERPLQLCAKDICAFGKE